MKQVKVLLKVCGVKNFTTAATAHKYHERERGGREGGREGEIHRVGGGEKEFIHITGLDGLLKRFAATINRQTPESQTTSPPVGSRNR